MKTKNIAVIALAVFLVVVLWHRMVYSSMASQASKADQAAEDATANVKTLQAQVKQLTGTDDKKSHKASLEELGNAIPTTPAVSSLLRSIDNVRILSGVSFQSIVPTAPVATGGIASVNLGITVQGSYARVRDYQERLSKLSRLIVIDNVSMAPGGAEGGGGSANGGPVGDVFAGQGAAPTIQLQLTARMFTQQVPLGTVAGGAVAGGRAPTATQPGTKPITPAAPGVQNS